jgi:hypothetical protein
MRSPPAGWTSGIEAAEAVLDMALRCDLRTPRLERAPKAAP